MLSKHSNMPHMVSISVSVFFFLFYILQSRLKLHSSHDDESEMFPDAATELIINKPRNVRRFTRTEDKTKMPAKTETETETETAIEMQTETVSPTVRSSNCAKIYEHLD